MCTRQFSLSLSLSLSLTHIYIYIQTYLLDLISFSHPQPNTSATELPMAVRWRLTGPGLALNAYHLCIVET